MAVARQEANLGAKNAILPINYCSATLYHLKISHSQQKRLRPKMEHIDNHLNKLLDAREFPKTICPSEAARALSSSELEALGAGSWHDLMPTIRERVFEMREQGSVEILQKGNVLPMDQSLEDTSGPIRVRRCH